MSVLTVANAIIRRSAARNLGLENAAIALMVLFIFFAIKHSALFFILSKPDYLPVPFVIAVGAGALFSHARYKDFPTTYSALTRSTAIGILIFLLVEPPSFTLTDEHKASQLGYINWAYWPALAAAALGTLRPSFIFAPAFYVISTRWIAESVSGFYLGQLDIRYMMEMGELLSIGACIILAVNFLSTKINQSFRGVSEEVALCIAFLAIGLHLANYFWSGYAKLFLGPHVWSWAFDNATQNMMLTAYKKGFLPTATFPWITQHLHDLFARAVVFSNLAVLAVQLFALVAVFRMRWLFLSCIVYDVFHACIYLFGGLFFWPWVWNNASIMLAARGETDQQVGLAPKFCCVASILLGFSFQFGDAARLAWFDIADIKIPVIQAESEAGHWIDVPTSFFMSHSYGVSHGYFDLVEEPGHYPPSIWGSVPDYERALTSGQCLPPALATDPETPPRRAQRLETFGRFLAAHHTKMLDMTDRYGRQIFYFRFHHHPSNPLLYGEFNSVELHRIRRYRLLTESVCLGLRDGELTEREIKQTETIFNVK